MRIKIEKISLKDIPMLTRMVIKLWPECNYDEEYEFALNTLNNPNLSYHVAKSGELYIGFVQLSIRTDHVEGSKSNPVAYIEGIYVDPEYRNTGVGAQLVQFAEEWGAEKGCAELASDTELDNALSIGFHESLGFRIANRVVCFIKSIEK